MFGALAPEVTLRAIARLRTVRLRAEVERLLDFPNPVDRQSVQSSERAFRRHAATEKVGVYVVPIKNPKITSVSQNVETASTMAENTAHTFAHTAAISDQRIHLALQKSRTLRT
jgi:hypothetical protein